jgi:hypothetical protein
MLPGPFMLNKGTSCQPVGDLRAGFCTVLFCNMWCHLSTIDGGFLFADTLRARVGVEGVQRQAFHHWKQ